MKILNNFGKVECHTIIHSAQADGTIISVEHHAKSNPQIHKWEQTSIPSEYRGWITFYSNDGTVVSRYDTIRHNGLYYITNLNIISPPENATMQVNTTNTDNPSGETPTQPDVTDTAQQETDSDDTYISYDITLDNEYIPGQLHPDTLHPIDNPIRIHSTHATTRAIQPIASTSQTALEKDMLNFEIWHQRLGHVSEHKLRQTQKCAIGIPQFHSTNLPPIVRCRICDIARLQKAPRGPSKKDPTDLVPGQMFHMDIGFFRGPSNLEAVVDRQSSGVCMLSPNYRSKNSKSMGFSSEITIRANHANFHVPEITRQLCTTTQVDKDRRRRRSSKIHHFPNRITSEIRLPSGTYGN
jgi:hypothetical protein